MQRIAAFLIATAIVSAPLGLTGWHGAQAQEAKKEKTEQTESAAF